MHRIWGRTRYIIKYIFQFEKGFLTSQINYTKSKVMIFNKGSRLSNVKFYIDETELEIVRHYKYLGDFQIIELNHRHRGDNLYASVLIIQVNMNDQNHQLTH
jgi:phosphatidylserine decarboxylase